MRAWYLLVVMAAACGADVRSGAAGPGHQRTAAVDPQAVTLVREQCGACHSTDNHDGLPALDGRAQVSVPLGAIATQRVCAGEMPPGAELSDWERGGVVRALCAMSGVGCGGCPTVDAHLRARTADAAIRIVHDKTSVDVKDTVPAAELKMHIPGHFVSAKLDPTYLLLYTLLAWEGCGSAASPDGCMDALMREELWSAPTPPAHRAGSGTR